MPAHQPNRAGWYFLRSNTVSSNNEPLCYRRMLQFNRENPSSKEVYKEMQKWHLDNKVQDGVFCPLSEVMSSNVVSKLFKKILFEQVGSDFSKKIADVGNLTKYFVYGAWRNTLGIYEIDSEIYKQTIKSPIPLETPTDIFERLPEWCVYIKLPEDSGFVVQDKAGGTPIAIDGFWALFDYSTTNEEKERKLAIEFNPVEEGIAQSIPVLSLQIDSVDTVEDSINEYRDFQSDIISRGSELERNAFVDELSRFDHSKIVQEVLSIILWLCAEEPDISNIHGEAVTSEELKEPRYGINKKTGSFVPPNKPSIYHIGRRLGGEVRTFNERNASDSSSATSSRKRPHIRRGHWHGVWTGTGQNKQFKVYWQPAIFVNSR